MDALTFYLEKILRELRKQTAMLEKMAKVMEEWKNEDIKQHNERVMVMKALKVAGD